MGTHVTEQLIGAGAQIDRRLTPARGGRPAGLQELLAGADEVVGAGTDQFGVVDEHQRVVGQHIDQQFETVDQRRDQRLHALDGLPGSDLLEQLGQLGVVGHQVGRPAAHLVGDQQLPAGRRLNLGEGAVGGALVGHLEIGDGVYLVTEEVETDGVVLGGREDVDDAAAHRELAATLHQVDPLVGGGHQVGGQLAHFVLSPSAQPDRTQLGQPGNLRLQHRPDRRHHDSGGRGLIAPGDAAQHLQAAAHGVGAGAETLVRQGLPSRVVDDLVVVQQRDERGGELLRLAECRGDHQ